MSWLDNNWLKVGVLVFGIGSWAAWQEFEAQAGVKHRKDACLQVCISRCQRICVENGILPEQCRCDYCYEECGY